MLTRDQETIIAQCTPSGSGAIALIRMSGDNAIEIVDKIAKIAAGKLINLPTHTIQFGWIVDDKEKHIDQVLFLLMRAPKTFTGLDTVEISCHNNPFVIEQILNQALKKGARLADPGEFTKRAFLNEKIDLVQAEAINELIHANTQTALKHSLSQMEGSFSQWISHLEKELLKIISFCEVSFEFLDEEISFDKQIKKLLESLAQTIEKLKKSFDQQQRIRQGIRIAIIGNVNAGKSSLLNALLEKDRAIVTHIPGTTRDVIEAGIYRGGNYWTLIDTAGLRETKDKIELEGIARSEKEAQRADVILLVFDGSERLSEKEIKIYNEIIQKYPKRVVLIKNKTDLQEKTNSQIIHENVIEISTKNKSNIKKVERAIEEKISILLSSLDLPFLINQRQFNTLLSLEKEVRSILKMMKKEIAYELLSHHLKLALQSLSELSGKTIEKKNLDLIFDKFCVGK